MATSGEQLAFERRQAISLRSMFILLAQFGSNFPTPDYDEIAGVLRDRGHKVWVATPDGKGDLVVHDGVETVAELAKSEPQAGKTEPKPVLNRLASLKVEWLFAFRLRRFLDRYKPDIAHLNRSKLTFFWLIPLLASRKTAYILDWRQISERNYKGFWGKIKNFIALQYRRIPSRYIYDQACFLHAAGAKKVLGSKWQKWATVVPLAVNAQFLNEQDKGDHQSEEKSPVRFVYIGTLSRVRRLERIILAAQRIQMDKNGRRKFEVTFIGPDKTNGLYQEMIEQFELADVVSVKPPVRYQDIPSELKKFDVAFAYVPEYPLDWQYHPTLKVLEYRAIGMPIIATDFEPNREVVQDGINGLLIINAPQNIAQAMIQFIDDENFLARCKVNAQEMREAMLWEDVSQMYESLYEKLLQNR